MKGSIWSNQEQWREETSNRGIGQTPHLMWRVNLCPGGQRNTWKEKFDGMMCRTWHLWAKAIIASVPLL